jgi:hypothetical protein
MIVLLLQMPRSAHVSVVYGEHMVVFGGFDGQDRLNDMWRISLVAKLPEWEPVEQVCLHG